MRNEKLKKQLMAVGIQRNDAAAFIRSYRKIQKSGKAEQFRDIMAPYVTPIQTVIRNVPVHTLQVTVKFSDDEIYSVGGEEAERMVLERLSNQLAAALLDSGYLYTDQAKDRHGLRIRASVMVVDRKEYHG